MAKRFRIASVVCVVGVLSVLAPYAYSISEQFVSINQVNDYDEDNTWVLVDYGMPSLLVGVGITAIVDQFIQIFQRADVLRQKPSIYPKWLPNELPTPTLRAGAGREV